MPRQVRPTTVHPIALRELEVVRVTDLTPGMRRITLTGEELAAHTTTSGEAQGEFVSTGFDDDIRLLYPYPGETVPVLPIVKDGSLTFPKDRKVLARAYSVRSYDSTTRELAVDFVRHGIGLATTWAYRATPGDRIHLIGPTVCHGLPEDTDWWLVAGDETALPAIGRLLEEAPEDTRAQVFIEIAQDSDRQELPQLSGVKITWLTRDGADPGTTTVLLDAVRNTAWWEGSAFAWIAGEQATVRDLRRHLNQERGLEKNRIDFTGYWKHQPVTTWDSDAALPDPERNQAAFETFHELAELLPPLAIRTAANLGIAEHLLNATTTLPALARATATQPRALEKFLRYLTTINVLAREGEHYRLTEIGEFLADEYVVDHLHRQGVQGRKELAFHGLEQALRTGGPADAHVTGVDYRALRTDSTFEHKLLENTAEFAAYLAAPLATTSVFETTRHLVLHATGANAVAAALLARHDQLSITIPALPTTAAWLREDLPRTITESTHRDRVRIVEQSVFEPTPAADTILFIHTLEEHPDPEAALVLRRAAASLSPAGRLLLLEDTLDPADVDEHEAEEDLLDLCLHGSGLRTHEELAQLVTTAGLNPAGTTTFGWGNTLRILTTS